MHKQFNDLEKYKIAQIKDALKPGMLIMHTRCMDIIEEHVFRCFNCESWITATETTDTSIVKNRTEKNINDMDDVADDISPLNITHVNRLPINIFLDDSPEGLSFDKERNFRYNP